MVSRFKLPPGISPHVLLVEDNPLNQKVAKIQLTKLGLQVETATNGLEALTAVLNRHYDIIFMDCQMPKLNGYETTRELRQRELPGTRSRVIAMTAHSLPGDRQKCLAAGMDAYISKPLSSETLTATLTELFQESVTDDTTVRAPAARSPDSQRLTPDYPLALQPPLIPVENVTSPLAMAHHHPEGQSLSQVTAAQLTLGPASPTFPDVTPALTTDLPANGVKGSSDSREICDPATLAELQAEGGTLLPELIDIFQTEMTKSLAELARALEARDDAAIIRIAHTLKGSAGTFGATNMHEMAGTIEQAARAGHRHQVAGMFADFCAECELVRRYLRVAIGCGSSRSVSGIVRAG